MRSIKEAGKSAETQAAMVLAAYWWVGTVGKEADASIVVRQHKDTTNGASFPIYENKKILQPNEKLVLYAPPKQQHVPLSGAAEVVSGAKAKRHRRG